MLKFTYPHQECRNKRSMHAERGMSIVELLVGVAIGLFIVTGAMTLFANNVYNSRQLLLESRINQDMRGTMDLIVRELRRGGYWGNSIAGATASLTSNGASMTNPYAPVTVSGSEIRYSYTRDATENNALDASTEQFGFKLNTSTNAVQMYVGDAWQTQTNTDIVRITALTVTPTVTSIDIRDACAKTCTDTVVSPTMPTDAQNCPRVKVRTYSIVLTGQSVANATVSRTLESQVRVRNDAMAGFCPI